MVFLDAPLGRDDLLHLGDCHHGQLPVMAISEVKEIIPPKRRVKEDHSHDLDALVIDPGATMGDD